MILCHGETLIDFLPTEARDGSPTFRPANGGSPGNVALTLARLDVPVGFVGGISTDFFGEAIAKGLADAGVALDYVARLDRPTMLAFVNLEADEPRYAFYDEGAAARHWRLDDMPPLGREVDALHFGSLSLIRQPAADSFAELMRREAGRRIVSFDPNIRPSLVEDEPHYRARLDEFFHAAHVIKLSGADLAWIAPDADPALLAAEWLNHSARLVVLTRGGEGATIFGRKATASLPAIPVQVADTVGAGDAFMGGLIAALHDREWLDRDRLETASAADLAAVLDFALAVSAITVNRVGADPPRRADLPARFAVPAPS